jgi:hypothetical protein
MLGPIFLVLAGMGVFVSVIFVCWNEDSDS